MALIPRNVNLVTMFACVMHNLLLNTYPLAQGETDSEDAAHNVVPGAWRNEQQMPSLVPLLGHRQQQNAKDMRDYLATYYESPAGAVAWQERMIRPEQRL